jgi:hypothetical protein
VSAPPPRLTDALTALRDRRLRAAGDAVAEDVLLAPMTAVLEDADRFRTAVEAARRSGPLQGTAPSLRGVGRRGSFDFQSWWMPGERGSGSWLRCLSVVSVRPEGSRAQTCLRPGRLSHP